MVDVVGLRFVTEGQKEALASLEMYRNGIRQMKHVQDRHVSEMNRALRQETQAFALNQRLKQRYIDEEVRARQQDMRAFALVQRTKAQTLKEEERAQAQAARATEQAERSKARATQQGIREFATAHRLRMQMMAAETRRQQEVVAAARAQTGAMNQRLGVTGPRAVDSGATFERLAQVQDRLEAGARAWTSAVNQGLGVTGQRATDLGATFARLDQVQDNLAAGARRWTDQLNERLGVTGQRATELGASFSALEARQESLVRETQQLAAAYNPVMAAATVYEQRVEQLNRAHQLGVLTADQLEAQLMGLRTTYNAIGQDVNRASAFVNNFSAANTFAGRRMSNMGVMVQQTGYQVGDFLVQVQSGTNAFVAFGQQATQVVGTLTMLGGKWILIGSALGIAIPLFTAVAAGLMRTRAAANDAANGVDMLADSIASARRETARFTFEIEAMRRGFADMQEFAFIQSIEQAQARIQELSRQIYGLEQIGAVTAPTERLLRAEQERLAALREQLDAYVDQRNEHERLSDQADAQQRSAESLRQTYESITGALAFLRQTARDMADTLKEDAQAAASALQVKIAEAADESRASAQAARELKEELAEAKRAAEQLAAVDMKSSIAEAADEAARVARNLAAAQARIISMRQQGSGRGGDPRVPPGPDPARFDWTAPGALEGADAFLGLGDIDNGSGGGSGGGGVAQTLESITDGLIRQQQERQELLRLGERERAQREVYLGLLQQLGDQASQYTDAEIQGAAARIEAQQRLTQELERQENLGRQLGDTMGGLFTSAIQGADSFRSALAGVLRNLASMLANGAFRALMAPSGPGGGVTGAFGTLVGSLLGFSRGGVFSGGALTPFAQGAVVANLNRAPGANVIPFASGGVVGGPTTFPMSGGRTGLMGEAGPEAIMPLKRGRGGRLGVAAEPQAVQVDVRVHMDENGNWQANVERIADRRVQRSAPQIVQESVRATYSANSERKMR